MIPVTAMVSGKGTVSYRIKGRYDVNNPSSFTDYFRPVVFWNITYGCNLNCIHCYINAGPKPYNGELTTEKAIQIVDQLANARVPLIVFSGGEPFYRKDFLELLKYAATSTSLKLAVSTNGTLITEKTASILSELNIQYIGISLDSHIPSEHDNFRKIPGAFTKAVKGIKTSLEYGIPVGIRMTLTRKNIEEIHKMVDLAIKLGVSRLSLYILDTIGRAKQITKLLPTISQLNKFTEQIISLSREHADELEILIVRANFLGIKIASQLAKNIEEFNAYLKMIQAQGDCGRKTISIYPDGTVRPCQFFTETIIGDLQKQSFKEVVSTKNKKLLPFLKTHHFLKGKRCGNCKLKEICGGGSRNRAEAIHGDFWGDEPLCDIDYDAIIKKLSSRGRI